MKFLNSQKGQTSMIVGGIVVLVVILGAVVFLMGKKDDGSPTEQTATPTQAVTTTAPEETPADGAMTKGKKVTLEVSGSNFKFVPNVLSVNEGDTVTIKFTNAGGFHDFMIDEFNVKIKQLGDGQSEEVTFVANKKGTFEFYCSVGKHRQMGMKGTLTVN